MDSIEIIAMELITHAGNAKSLAIQAIREARKGDFEKADKLLNEANEEMNNGHASQAKLLFKEANGEKVAINLLIIHAQDHVMNALTIKDLANEMIQNMKEFKRN